MMTPALACLLGEGTCLAASTRPKITLHPTQRLSGCRYAVKQTRTAVHAESTNGNATNSSATNGSASIELPSGEQQHVIQMVNLVHKYFDQFMSQSDLEVAANVLESHAMHKDMVRDVGYEGVKEIQEYVSKLKQDFPKLYVKATQFGVANGQSIFVAFEGRATDDTPLFKGVDLFCFNAGATRIKEVQVYRSNWMGAKGHEERKRSAGLAS